MARVQECDRCKRQERDDVANRHLPNGWETVCGADLCPKCSSELHRFLQPLPQDVASQAKEK